MHKQREQMRLDRQSGGDVCAYQMGRHPFQVIGRCASPGTKYTSPFPAVSILFQCTELQVEGMHMCMRSTQWGKWSLGRDSRAVRSVAVAPHMPHTHGPRVRALAAVLAPTLTQGKQTSTASAACHPHLHSQTIHPHALTTSISRPHTSSSSPLLLHPCLVSPFLFSNQLPSCPTIPTM